MNKLLCITGCLALACSFVYSSEQKDPQSEFLGFEILDDSVILNHILPNLSHKELLRFAAMSKSMRPRIKDLLPIEYARRGKKQNEESKNLFNASNSLCWFFCSCEATGLDLSDKGLKYIYPGAFEGLVKLTDLYLYDNQLKKLEPGTFEELTDLEAIYLSHNYLKHIEPEVFQGLNNLKYLDLENNPSKSENIQALKKALPNVIVYWTQDFQ